MVKLKTVIDKMKAKVRFGKFKSSSFVNNNFRLFFPAFVACTNFDSLQCVFSIEKKASCANKIKLNKNIYILFLNSVSNAVCLKKLV